MVSVMTSGMTRRVTRKRRTKRSKKKNLHHAYKDPDRTICIIFGGKVALETGRERKLTAQDVMALANSHEKTTDPKYQNWSHRSITFSRADQWAKIPEPGCFPSFWTQSSKMSGSRRCSLTAVAPWTSISTTP
jgi:hypothetical protein